MRRSNEVTDKGWIPFLIVTSSLSLTKWLLLRMLFLINSAFVAAVTCDDNAFPAASMKANKLTPNQFHKICPATSSLGEPMCGDGTAFSFYYSSPVQRRSSSKILIEFLGGGACWDEPSCSYFEDRLTFPTDLDDYIGFSCTEIQAGLDNKNNNRRLGDDIPMNMLCARELGNDLDMREYHTIIVPYCTQDTHAGSNTVTYSGNNNNDDDGNSVTVHHTGGRNMMATLEWVYENFPHPEHVIVTGCSAGGTAVPLAYDLLHHHYNGWTKRGTAVSVMADSPVYLTPSYFLENGLPNWNVQPMMKQLRFNYNKYSHSEDYTTRVLHHILRRGSNKDKWGLITHDYDPVSLLYFQYMAKNYFGGNNENRYLEDNSDALEEEWWSQLSSSLDTVSSKHSNLKTYVLEGEGHCSFGLYYGFQEGGTDFEDWAVEQLRMHHSPHRSGTTWFWMSALVGCALVGASIYHKQGQQRQTKEESNSSTTKETPLNDDHDARVTSLGRMKGFLKKMSSIAAFVTRDSPVTVAYGAALTIYFIRLLTWDSWERVLYNPSIGPTAVTLSQFGINNPTLVVYHFQVIRVLGTSTLLCSGIITYILVMVALYRNIRPLEQTMRTVTSSESTMFPSRIFLEVTASISIGSNLIYACFMSGATCSSIAMVLGLQAFSCTMRRYHQQDNFPRPFWRSLAMYLVTSLVFPFNNWLIMLSAILLGIGLARWVYIPRTSPIQEAVATTATDSAGQKQYLEVEEDHYDPQNQSGLMDFNNRKTTMMRQNRLLEGLLGFFALLIFILVTRIRRPNSMYEQPFMTGCELVYTTHVSDAMNSAVGEQFMDENGNNRLRRWLEEQQDENNNGEEERDEDYMCAQFCVPHVFSLPFVWSANIFTGFDVQKGFCEDVGYSQHIADKTFAYKSYSVDIELYFDDNYNRDNGSGDNRQ